MAPGPPAPASVPGVRTHLPCRRPFAPACPPQASRGPIPGRPWASSPSLRGPEPAPRAPQASSAEQLRKEGNELFKCGDYEGALTAYTQALDLGATPQDQAVLHRNRAACHLKLVRGRAAVPLPAGRPDVHRAGHSPFPGSLGRRVEGHRVTREPGPLLPGECLGRGTTPLRLLVLLLQEEYEKAETEASKGRGVGPGVQPWVELLGWPGAPGPLLRLLPWP